MTRKLSTNGFIFLIVLAMLSWGGSWPAGKLLSGLARVEVIIFWRYFITSLSIVPLLFIFKQPLRIERRSLFLLIFGAVAIIIYNQLFIAGLKVGLAGAGGVLTTSLNPIITFSLASVIYRESVGPHQKIGLLLGVIGGAVLLNVCKLDLRELLAGGNVFFLLAALSWSILTLISQKTQQRVPFLTYSFYLYAFSTLIELFLALPYGLLSITGEPLMFWGNIIYLSIFATTFGATVYFTAAGKIGSARASSFTFLVPTSAMLFSWLLLGEVPKLSTIIGGLIAVTAVYLLNQSGCGYRRSGSFFQRQKPG